MDRGTGGGRWAPGVALAAIVVGAITSCASLTTQRGVALLHVQVASTRSVLDRPAAVDDPVRRGDDRPTRATAAPSFDAELPIVVSASGSSFVVDRPASPDRAADLRPVGGQPVGISRAHRPALAPRLVLIGDSISASLCPVLANSTCFAFPGAWVADARGVNLADQFVTQAAIGPNDTVVLSSIGGWHSPGVDDTEILRRLNALFERVDHLAERVIVLVAPTPNFPLCVNPTTHQALALLGDRHAELCATQAAVAELERGWPAITIPIEGPYLADQEHPSTAGLRTLIDRIESARGSNG